MTGALGGDRLSVAIYPIPGIPEARPGEDVATLLLAALEVSGPALEDGDVVVVTHKLVSKCEGALEEVDEDDPDAHRQVVERESVKVLRRRAQLTIAETRHGLICANAGVDRSNVAPGLVVKLPVDPDGSAHRIRTRLELATGRTIGVVVTDTFGRAWRRGLTDVAIGLSGIPSILDLRGSTDTYGRVLEVTEVAVADEIASAADLVMGKATGIPAVVVKGLGLPPGDGRGADLIRAPEEDLFR